MNIFASSTCPIQSALALDDKRLVKMTCETAQLLSCAVRSWHLEDEADALGLYKNTHTNHPLIHWTRASRANFAWLHDHGIALAREYTRRYDKRHSSQNVTLLCGSFLKMLPEREGSPFANCARHLGLGIDFTYVEDRTEAYRLYLNARWATDKKRPTWKRAQPPAWAEFEWIGDPS